MPESYAGGTVSTNNMLPVASHFPSSLNLMPKSIVPAVWNDSLDDSTPKWLPSPIDLVLEGTKHGQESGPGPHATPTRWS